MAISRGKRKKSKEKAIKNAVPEIKLKAVMQISRGKRKRHKRKSYEEDTAGVKLTRRRNRLRGKRVRTLKPVPKPQTEKQVKRKAKRVKTTKAQLRKQQRLKELQTPEEITPTPVTETDTDKIPLEEDIIYSTFDSMLTDMGEYDDLLKDIVNKSIEKFGMKNAMKKLEDYMYNTKDKNNIFNAPLKYNDFAALLVSDFAQAMYGRPISLTERNEIERVVETVGFENI